MKKNSNRSHFNNTANLSYFANVSGRSAKKKKYAKEAKENGRKE